MSQEEEDSINGFEDEMKEMGRRFIGSNDKKGKKESMIPKFNKQVIHQSQVKNNDNDLELTPPPYETNSEFHASTELQSEIEKLQTEIGKLQNHIATKTVPIEEFNDLFDENCQLKSIVATANDQTKLTDGTATRTENDALRSKLAEKDTQIQDLNNQIQLLKEEIENRDRCFHESLSKMAMSTNPDHVDLIRENDDLKIRNAASVSEVNMLRQQLAQYEEQGYVTSAKYSSENEMVSAISSVSLSIMTNNRKQLTENAKKIAEFDTIIHQLTLILMCDKSEIIQKVRALSFKASESDRLRREANDAQIELAQRAILESMRAQVQSENGNAEEEARDLRDQNIRLAAEVASRVPAAELEDAYRRAEDAEAEVLRLDEANQELSAELESARAECEELRDLLGKCAQRAEDLNQQTTEVVQGFGTIVEDGNEKIHLANQKLDQLMRTFRRGGERPPRMFAAVPLPKPTREDIPDSAFFVDDLPSSQRV